MRLNELKPADGSRPAAGLSSFNRISAYLYLNQVRYFVDHAYNGRRLFKFHGLMDSPQPKAMDTSQLPRSPTELALDKGDLDSPITHRQSPGP